MGALLLAALLGLQAVRLDEALRYDLGDLGGALYAGSFARAFDSHGILEEKGRPILNVIPVVGDPIKRPYLMHPPLTYWATWASTQVFGWSPFSLRFPGFVACALGLLALAATGALRGRGAAWIWAAALAAATPQALIYGSTPHNQPYVLCAVFMMAAALAAFRHRGGLVFASLVVFGGVAGCFSDWEFALFAPFLAWVALAGEAPRRARALLLLGFTALLGTMLLGAWFLAVETEAPHDAGWLETLRFSLDRVWGKKLVMDEAPGSQLVRILEHVARLFPATGLLAALVGLFVAVKGLAARGRRGEAIATLLLLFATALDCGLVAEHAALHPYWTLLAIPAFGLLAFRGADALARGRRGGLLLVILLIVGEGVGRAEWERRRLETPLLRSAVAELDRRLPAHSLVVGYTPALMAARYLTDRPVYVERLSVERLALLREWTRTRHLHTANLYYLEAPGEATAGGPPAPRDGDALRTLLEGLPAESFTVPHFEGEGTVTYRLFRLWPR